MIRNILMSTLLSLRAHKLRVFLTMVGIIIGIASVVTIAALGEGVRRKSLDLADTTQANMMTVMHGIAQTDDSGMSYVEDTFTFTKSDLRRISRIEGVESVLPNYNSWSGSSMDMFDVNLDYFGAQANTAVTPFKEETRIQYGRDITSHDADRDVIILSDEVLQYGIVVDDPETLLGQAVSINGFMFEIIGIKAPYDYENMIPDPDYTWENSYTSVVPHAAYNQLTGSREIQQLKVKISETSEREMVTMAVLDDLMMAYPDDQGYFEEDRSNEQMMEEINTYINGIVMFLVAITAISLFVGGIGVMNIMYVSVTERKREIGIRRAIGAKPRMILWQFLLEAAFITFIGGIIGLLLGYGAALLVGVFISIPVILTPSIMIISTSVSVVTGLVFGIIPALSASRMDPIKAIYQ